MSIEIAYVLEGHSGYQDDVWSLINKAGFCNEFTPLGWLAVCGCRIESEGIGGSDKDDADAMFCARAIFDGPLPLLIERLRRFLGRDGSVGYVGYNCSKRLLTFRR